MKWDPRACVCVVMAAGGYPGNYEAGKDIHGLDRVSDKAVVFHSGTRQDAGRTLTSGGRVLGVTALGQGIAEALANVYAAVAKISFEGVHFRRDIGRRALQRS